MFTKPSGVADGDVLYLMVNFFVPNNPTGGNAITAPSGFTQVSTVGVYSNGAGQWGGVFMFRKVVTNAAGEPSTYTIGDPSGGYTGGYRGGTLYAVRGVDNTTPEADSGSGNASSGTVTTGATVDTVSDESLILFAVISNGGTFTTPSGMTNDFTGDGGDVACFSEVTTSRLAGATRSGTHTAVLHAFGFVTVRPAGVYRNSRTSGSNSGFGGESSFTTSSFTPGNGTLLCVLAVIQDNNVIGAAASDLTIADSLGTLTWTPRLTADVPTAVGNFAPHFRMWTTPITTGASMTVTVSSWNRGGAAVAVLDYTGYNTSSPVGVTAGPTDIVDGAFSLTLSGAPATTSEVLGIIAAAHGTTGAFSVTPGTGWVEPFEVDSVAEVMLEVESRSGSTSTTVSWADTNTGSDTYYSSFGVAIEIKVAAGADTTVTPSVVNVVTTVPAPTIIADLPAANPLVPFRRRSQPVTRWR